MLSGIAGPMLLGALCSLLGGLFLLPVLRKLRARQSISRDAPRRHQTKAGTPTMGGTIILLGGLVPTLLYLPGIGDLALRSALVLCTLGFAAIGFVDDLLNVRRGRNLGLRAREKLLGQFLVATAFATWFAAHDASATGSRVTWVITLLLGFHVLLLVGMSNAVNLTDGLDGLAAGVSMPVWAALAIIGGFIQLAPRATVYTDWGVVTFCGAFAGATLGYLWYNAHPAQVFMGDTGALAIGGGMAAAAIALHSEWVLLIAALVHVAEAASVVLQVASFKSTGRRIFKMSPLHHHFELCEMPETRIVARFAIASTLCSLTALAFVFRM